MMQDIIRLFKYRELIKNLVIKDLKLKYRGSMIGFFWSLLHPLLLICVYTFAFKYVLRIQMADYPFFLVVGLFPWTFFSNSLVMATDAIIQNGNLIKKIYFPRDVIPLATVFFNFTQLAFALIVLFPILIVLGKMKISFACLAFFPILFLQLIFTLGLALLLSAITVFLRDVRHFTEIATMILFWLTPIIYPLSIVPENLRTFLQLNPLADFTNIYQDALLRGRSPDIGSVMTIVVWTLIVFAIGRYTFRHYAPRFAEEV